MQYNFDKSRKHSIFKLFWLEYCYVWHFHGQQKGGLRHPRLCGRMPRTFFQSWQWWPFCSPAFALSAGARPAREVEVYELETKIRWTYSGRINNVWILIKFIIYKFWKMCYIKSVQNMYTCKGWILYAGELYWWWKPLIRLFCYVWNWIPEKEYELM